MKVIRRIRMQLKEGVRPTDISPPYADFLLEHALELKRLRDKSGEPLIFDVIPRCNALRTVFVTDIIFSSEVAYAEYQKMHADAMRSRIPETYPAARGEASPFQYTISTNEAATMTAFNALLPDSETLTQILPTAAPTPHAATGHGSFWSAGQSPDTECPAASSVSSFTPGRTD